MYLLDTMVLSEGFKRGASPAVMQWMGSIQESTAFVSVISLGEMERGIRKVERGDEAGSRRYRAWLEATLLHYAGRILPVTIEIARRWGLLTYDLKHTNSDLLIAATALAHDLTVVTRNVRHFAPTGAKLLNPYEA